LARHVGSEAEFSAVDVGMKGLDLDKIVVGIDISIVLVFRVRGDVRWMLFEVQ
jgi:hypothetical protein